MILHPSLQLIFRKLTLTLSIFQDSYKNNVIIPVYELEALVWHLTSAPSRQIHLICLGDGPGDFLQSIQSKDLLCCVLFFSSWRFQDVRRIRTIKLLNNNLSTWHWTGTDKNLELKVLRNHSTEFWSLEKTSLCKWSKKKLTHWWNSLWVHEQDPRPGYRHLTHVIIEQNLEFLSCIGSKDFCL